MATAQQQLVVPPLTESLYVKLFRLHHGDEYQRVYQWNRFESLLKRFEKKGVIVGRLAPEDTPFTVSLEDFDDIKDAMKELSHDGALFRYSYKYPILSFTYVPPKTLSPLRVTTQLMEALLMIKEKLGVVAERVYEERGVPPGNTIMLDGNNVASLIEYLKLSFPPTFVSPALRPTLLTYDYKASSGVFRWRWESQQQDQNNNKRGSPDSAKQEPPVAKSATLEAPPVQAPPPPQAPPSEASPVAPPTAATISGAAYIPAAAPPRSFLRILAK
jgi:hypothetical protein